MSFVRNDGTSQEGASIREKVASFRCNVRAYYGTAINCRDAVSSFRHAPLDSLGSAKILDEGSLGVDWPLISDEGLLIQEFLMADPSPLPSPSLFCQGKRRRLIRGRRHFAKKFLLR